MSAKNTGPDGKFGFNYMVLVDLVVAACIVVIAGRPDALAITVSAVIVAILALIYRFSVGVKSYVAKRSRKAAAAKAARERTFAATRQSTRLESPVTRYERRKSWLSDAD